MGQPLGPKVDDTVEIAAGVKMTFVLVPPGKFLMGSPPDEADRSSNETLHAVTLTEPFDLATTEVTQAQYEALTGKTPSKFKGANRPVESVNWQEARDYAVNLTEKRNDSHLYRLPTEAEWEYACRGGRPSSQRFGVGDGHSISSTREANFGGKGPSHRAHTTVYLLSTTSVVLYPPSALGLRDMHGNVAEWCADWYDKYPTGSVTNPTGPAQGEGRVVRGGSWASPARDCRAAARSEASSGFRSKYLGFRLARSIPSAGK
jgi:formylglycine-generating enzyme required for sulfatase activity